jgi:L,D-transpeptidase catalytic domain
VTWFPAGATPTAIVTPAPGATLTPTSPITVAYSRAPAAMPTLSADGHGRWRHVDTHTVRYAPGGAGFGLGTHVELTLPGGARLATGATTTSWTVPPGSTLRLQQLLADQGYLPLTWQPAGAPVARTAAAQRRAAVDAPKGSFSWRFANTPSALKRLWSSASPNDITRGAVMAFESDHGLDVDGLVGPRVWATILAAEMTGKRNAAGYSYVLVHRHVPQSLTLWHDGQTVLTTPANSGVPAAPTQLGTFPVYLRLRTQTMTGTNPDGSHYSDRGIKWISYFNGGDAIHGFRRASYGTPQSVGCVELPIAAAGRVWPHTPIGTLVTIVR